MEERCLKLFTKLNNIKEFNIFDEFSYAISEQNENSIQVIQNSICCIAKIILDMLQNNEIFASDEFKNFALSVVMRIDKEACYTNSFLENVLSCSILCHEDYYYFAWNQIKAYRFRRRIIIDSDSKKLHRDLYKKAYDMAYNRIKEKLKKIDIAERNRDTVLVYTIQYLSGNHAPTKTVNERLKTLVNMGKKVYFINTCEQYKAYGYIPVYNPCFGAVNKEFYKYNRLDLDGNDIWFRQLSDIKGIVKLMEEVIEEIERIKPYYILSIGTGSIIADLSANIVPAAAMSLVFSSVPQTENCIKILGRKLTDEEKEINTQDVVESRFTFELKPQSTHFTRKDYDISNDAFVIVVVGIRLDYEITDEFLTLLDNVCSKGAYVVFAGIFDTYSEKVSKYSNVADNSKFIGYCDDMLALMEICDLYVNPKRVGGGFSVIEAFTKGKPGVYIKEGDVYAAGGEEFGVKDYAEMQEVIIEYMQDEQFYNEQSVKAVERAKLMTDSKSALIDMDRKICELIEEKYW